MLFRSPDLHTNFSRGRSSGLVFPSLSEFSTVYCDSHSHKGFGIVNKAEIDVFLEFPCFLYNPVNVGNLISGSSPFSKPSLDIWKFLVHITLKPSIKDFKHDLTSMGDEGDCPMISTFFSTTLVGNWDED